MKVTGENPYVNLNETYVKNIQQNNKETTASSTTEETKLQDTVNISPLAKEIQKAEAQLASTPDIREDKIAEIKSRIADGTYTTDCDGVADAMVTESVLNNMLLTDEDDV